MRTGIVSHVQILDSPLLTAGPKCQYYLESWKGVFVRSRLSATISRRLRNQHCMLVAILSYIKVVSLKEAKLVVSPASSDWCNLQMFWHAELVLVSIRIRFPVQKPCSVYWLWTSARGWGVDHQWTLVGNDWSFGLLYTGSEAEPIENILIDSITIVVEHYV